jgi:hypothetical protein
MFVDQKIGMFVIELCQARNHLYMQTLFVMIGMFVSTIAKSEIFHATSDYQPKITKTSTSQGYFILSNSNLGAELHQLFRIGVFAPTSIEYFVTKRLSIGLSMMRRVHHISNQYFLTAGPSATYYFLNYNRAQFFTDFRTSMWEQNQTLYVDDFHKSVSIGVGVNVELNSWASIGFRRNVWEYNRFKAPSSSSWISISFKF